MKWQRRENRCGLPALRVCAMVAACSGIGLFAAEPQKANETIARQAALVPAGRLPFPEIGETLEKPLPARRLVKEKKSVPKATVAPSEVIPWHQAHEHVGKTVTVEGTIVVARNTGKVCFLNFARDWRGKFYVILFEDVLKSWPLPPEQYLLNKKIRVTGEVREHKGSPQIQVKDAQQVAVMES